jgi:hypothetical protein
VAGVFYHILHLSKAASCADKNQANQSNKRMVVSTLDCASLVISPDATSPLSAQGTQLALT